MRARLSAAVPFAFAFALFSSTTMPAFSQDSNASRGALASTQNLLVRTDNGPVRGTARATTIAFLGIPYAKPPVGVLRWRPPQRRGPWPGVLDATRFRNHCPQPAGSSETNAGEDCLFLNVYVPNDGNQRRELRPVMVWIYGGANASGASDFYDPTPLVETGGVIVVTVNYRVGAFGFLAQPSIDAEDHAIANYGVMDQQLALKWVRSNIAGFRGDPRNVTIFGESAGGLNVTTHLVSPLSAGLFDRAIVESGAYQLNTPSLAMSESLGIAFAKRIGCADQRAACLRAKSVADVLASAGTVNTPTSAYNQSTVDGRVLPQTQLSSLQAGRFNRVPVIQGNNSHEGRIFTPPALNVAGYEATLTAFAAAVGKTPAEAFAAYPLSSYVNPFEAASAALGDFGFACSAQTSNRLLSQLVPVYAYEFDDANADRPLGATHGSELKYLFRVSGLGPPTDGYPASLPAPSRELARAMRVYWTNFARSSAPDSAGVARWSPAPAGTVQLLSPPEPHSTSEEALSVQHKCAFWE